MSLHGRALTASLLCFAVSGWLAAAFAPWWQAIGAAAVGLVFLVAGLSRITWAPEYSAPEARKQESEKKLAGPPCQCEHRRLY